MLVLVGNKNQKVISLMSGQHPLTSKPCFSDGTHTSLLAAQSAWLAAENTALEVGDPGPGPAPDVRKRVTSLAPPPVGLDMVLLALREERTGDTKRGTIKSESVLSHFFPVTGLGSCGRLETGAPWMMSRTVGQ